MYNSGIPSEAKEGIVGTLISTIVVLVLVSSPFVFLGVIWSQAREDNGHSAILRWKHLESEEEGS